MNLFLEHWTFDPMIFVVAFTVVAHEVGLRRLAAHSRPERTRRRRSKSYVFYGGLALLVLSVMSPTDYWASSYFYIHMIEHVILSFATPMMVVLGAPWLPLMFFLPVGARRRVGRFIYLSGGAKWLRGIGRALRNPWVALISFNAVMIFWHLPKWFELSESNGFVHVWLMHGSFLVTGVLFWLQILPSAPVKTTKGAIWQSGAILGTNVVMTLMAMAMSIFSATSWYPSYAHIPGVTLSPFADQQIGAAILWVCGDFWAVPVLGMVIRRGIAQEGSMSDVFDRLIHRAIRVHPDVLARQTALTNLETTE
ncbi:MAG: cytochrome c oxidase assembly protein [Acidimicrobiales bacterium]